MRVTFTPYFRKRSKNDNHGTVYIRVTVQRMHIYCATFIYPQNEHWNEKAKKIKASAPNSEESNAVINQTLVDVEKQYLQHRLAGKPISYIELEKLYRGKNTANACYLSDVVKEYITINQFSEGREKHMNSFITMAAKLGLPKNIAATTSDHTVKFLQKMKAAGYSQNTITGYIKRAKTIFTYAVKKGYIQTSPMDDIKNKKWQVNRKFIDETDIARIERVANDLEPELKNIALKFLFSCYTGLRYSEFTNVSSKNIVHTENGLALNLWQKKTSKQKLLPLLPQALLLLDKIDWQHVSNQYYNSCLKQIGKAANVEKILSSHVGRHTFATIGLNKGIRMEVMQEYLGHGDIRTTQGYAHLNAASLAKEITAWNK